MNGHTSYFSNTISIILLFGRTLKLQGVCTGPSGMERLLLDRETWGSIPSRVKPMTLQLVFTVSLLDV